MVIPAENTRKTIAEPGLRERVEKELSEWPAEVNRNLSGYEQLQMFVIVSDIWTIENGQLTPSHEAQARAHRGGRRRKARGFVRQQEGRALGARLAGLLG